MEKIRKSVLKRLRVTKTGKILRAGSGINHFQAKKSRQSQLRKKRITKLGNIQKRMIIDYLKH